ncbi:hypothetical protein AB9P05_07650 [Roseivirga sp. BDSF3-8]|uniref:hypothetical protein n=1 Tax=Roseivirga sp. BDSF3-8 TaxID=3241598 RepID=UPI00353186A8
MKVRTNSLIEALSGLSGNVVFRTMKNGDIIMSRLPEKSETTPHQRKMGNMLKEAHLRATHIMENDEARADVYKKYAAKRGTHLRQAIVIDFMSKPKIVSVNWAHYQGLVAGSILTIEAIDDHRVEEVAITIKDMAGQVLEYDKVQNDRHGTAYNYIVKTETLPGDSEAWVSVSDYAGNVTTKSFRLSGIRVKK